MSDSMTPTKRARTTMDILRREMGRQSVEYEAAAVVHFSGAIDSAEGWAARQHMKGLANVIDKWREDCDCDGCNTCAAYKAVVAWVRNQYPPLAEEALDAEAGAT